MTNQTQRVHKRLGRGKPWAGGQRLTSLLIVLLLSQSAAAEDVIEFISGTKVTGTVTKIDKNAKRVTFESKIGARTTSRAYDYRQIHAVVYRGRRYVLTAKPTTGGRAERVDRTRAEVQRLIDTVGSTPPGWLSSTRLNYPQTLDFSWPTPGKKEWNNQKFVGHYVWDVINPNRSKWREGVKLLHHAVAAGESNPAARLKAMNQLGTLYASLLEDWPRAAYWWQQAGKGTPGAMGAGGFRAGYEVGLAKCYHRMGNKQMAIDMLNRSGGTPAIWCELGEHDRALQQAEKARKGWMKEQALVICGDVCRHAGWYDKALDYYTQATGLPNNDKYKRTIPQARERLAAMRAEQAIDLAKLHDGTYRGRSVGYSGTLEVAVAVQSNRITSVKVTEHIEKQYYSSLTDIPRQIVEKQSVKGIDATSSATITAEAIVRAASKALGK